MRTYVSGVSSSQHRQRKVPDPEAAIDAPATPFSADGDSLLNCKKFPVLREIRAAPSDFAAICCISGAESSKIKDLILIFFVSARGRAPGIQGGSR
jgi:hypothetical protein